MLFGWAGCKSACGGGGESIDIDGSSTVYPITAAIEEAFRSETTARVNIGVSGTGGGFQKFCKGETDISDASRPITSGEVEKCHKKGVEFIELPIAYDGISVVVHPENDWVDQMTVAELQKLWSPEAQGEITRWSQLREGWPDEKIELYGPGTDSGTYDYFVEAIIGEDGSTRMDFNQNEDDNVLVRGVSRSKNALGFFGFAYYEQNRDQLEVVSIDDEGGESGEGAVEPTRETIAAGSYQPLSRPLFIYINRASADRKLVEQFVDFYLKKAGERVPDAGYVPLPASTYKLVRERFETRTTGSLFEGGAEVGVTVETLLKQSK
jgi:phosphate transport system substrate-binding protein